MLIAAQDVNVLAVEDPLGIVYLIQNSQQFWSGSSFLSLYVGAVGETLKMSIE